ncbi:MAG: flagellar basal body-associated FliL family protein [Deltaproteobacteria bacterium]|nr:flagellar basal body-associated FliL family protein [Deltaproteobacteria bacterium]
MADEDKKESQTPPAAAGVPAPSSGIVGKVLGVVLPTIFSGIAAFGGAKLAVSSLPTAEDQHGKKVDEKKQPGLTIELKAFVVNVQDEKTGENKPMKMSVAIELEKLAKKEEFEPFIPRIRDAILGYVRNLSYQQVINPRTKERMTEDLLKIVHELGCEQAQRVLVQELVTQ